MNVFVSLLASREAYGLLRGYLLLASGRTVVALVTRQWAFGKHNRSKICYSFTTVSGEQVDGEGTDLTRSFFQEMAVIAFYNPSQPSKHIAYCCTGWRIKSSDNSLLEP
jgi:hypothetical protein